MPVAKRSNTDWEGEQGDLAMLYEIEKYTQKISRKTGVYWICLTCGREKQRELRQTLMNLQVL